MSRIQGLNQQIATQLQASELGETAEVTSQQQPRIYENLIQQSRLESPPADVDFSFTPVLDSPRNTDPTSNGQLYDRFNNTTDDFAVGLTTVIATLLHETGQEIRRASREGRAESIKAQAELQREQAELVRKGATMQLIGAIAGGAVQVGGAVASIGVASAGYTAARDGSVANGLVEHSGDTLLARGEQLNSIATSTNGLSQGMQSLVSAPFSYASQLTESEKVELEALRTELQQTQTEENELNQQAQDLLREVRQRLAEIQNAENQVVSRIFSV